MSANHYGHNNTSFTELVERLVGFPADQVETVFTAVVAAEYGLCPEKKASLNKTPKGVMPQSTLAGVWDARKYTTTTLESPKHVLQPRESSLLVGMRSSSSPTTSSYYDKYLKGTDNKKDN